MKVLVIVCSLLLVVACGAHKTAKSRNTKEVFHKKHMEDIEAKLELLKKEELKLEQELIDEEDDYDDDGTDDSRVFSPIDDDVPYDPCENKFCGAGRECVVTEDGEGVCQCVASCDVPEEERRRVCSNHNETWPSDCELYRQRCLCSESSPECTDEQYEHVHIDYYGECIQIQECRKGELEDFPRRLTEWLFSIMRDLTDRQTLSDHYMQLEKKAEADETKKWTYAVVWKWCDLDSHPKDNAISRHELFPLRAPLYTLEHCVAPFLDSCDNNNDHFISLKEWISCLKLDEENTQELESLCEEIRD